MEIRHFGSSTNGLSDFRDIDVAFILKNSKEKAHWLKKLKRAIPEACVEDAVRYRGFTTPENKEPYLHCVVITNNELNTLPIGTSIKNGKRIF